jgi:phosphoribosylglycinamide formyltransferase-1
MRIAVFASHGGSLLQAIIDACAGESISAEIALVVSNNSKSKTLQRAAENNIPAVHLSASTHPKDAALDGAILEQLVNANVEWVILAGYMRKLGPLTLNKYRNHIINTHPALLPRYGGEGFYGSKVHAAVLEAGDKETGATVHLVEAEYDSGPILSQVRVPVRPNDTVESLENRVKNAERNLLIATLMELPHQRKAG